MSQTVGTRRAMEMILTGKSISAVEAYHLGIVNRIYKDTDELHKEALRTAGIISKYPPKVVQMAKNAIYNLPFNEASLLQNQLLQESSNVSGKNGNET